MIVFFEQMPAGALHDRVACVPHRFCEVPRARADPPFSPASLTPDNDLDCTNSAEPISHSMTPARKDFETPPFYGAVAWFPGETTLGFGGEFFHIKL